MTTLEPDAGVDIVTLEQYAYVAQIVGVFLVVGSLIYVARQVSQNNLMLRAGAANERVQRDFDLSATVAYNREFAEVWAKSRSEFDVLDEVDKLRVLFHERTAIKHWHHMFALHRQKLLSERDWAELAWLVEFIGQNQGLRVAWATFKPSFEQPFQAFMDKQLGAGSTQS